MNIISSNSSANALLTSYLDGEGAIPQSNSQPPKALQERGDASRLWNDPAVTLELSDQAKATLAKAEEDRKVAENLNKQLGLTEENSEKSDIKQFKFEDVVTWNNAGAPVVENGDEVLEAKYGSIGSFTRQQLVDHIYGHYDNNSGSDYGAEGAAAFKKAYDEGTLTIQLPQEIPGYEANSRFIISDDFIQVGGNEEAYKSVGREYSITGADSKFGPWIISWGAETRVNSEG